MEETRILSINFARIRKGDVITNEQVEHHFIQSIMGREKYEAQVAEYDRGERPHHPIGRAHQAVCDEIMRECKELGYTVVARSRQKSIEVLTDAEAVIYRSNRANSALGLHRRQVSSLHHDINEDNLTKEEKRQLEANRQYHGMIALSIASGKRTLKEMQKGRLKLSEKPRD